MALFHYWRAELEAVANPRDKVFEEHEITIGKKVGEGHPSEVYEAMLLGKTQVASTTQDGLISTQSYI